MVEHESAKLRSPLISLISQHDLAMMNARFQALHQCYYQIFVGKIVLKRIVVVYRYHKIPAARFGFHGNRSAGKGRIYLRTGIHHTWRFLVLKTETAGVTDVSMISRNLSCIMLRRPPRSTLCHYRTLFRSSTTI